MEVGESKTFYFRNIHGGIHIDEVGRGAVRLVAHLDTVGVCPPRPLLGEVL